MKPFIFVIMLTAVLLGATSPGFGTVAIEGVAFEKTFQVATTQLHLRGVGLLRYMYFIKAYVGALYMRPQDDAGQALGATPRRLELHYFHAISAADFAEATTQKIRDNVSPETMASIQERLKTFNALYRDVKPGDRYALTYLPGSGTELLLNDQSLGRIPGDDFATAVFAIWLGPEPIDEDFRDTLLGVR